MLDEGGVELGAELYEISVHLFEDDPTVEVVEELADWRPGRGRGADGYRRRLDVVDAVGQGKEPVVGYGRSFLSERSLLAYLRLLRTADVS